MAAVFTAFLALSLVLLASLALGEKSQLGLNSSVLCSEVACSDGWICQNACSSWCGLSEPTEARPVCNPKSNTGDAPPPTVPTNLCSITDCGFRSVDFVGCPPGVTYGYKYAGTSCVRQGDGTCKWELADCQFIPTGPCGAADCGPKPADPSDTQINCTGNYVGTQAHYDCSRNNLGRCEWKWVPCQVGCKSGWQDTGGLCSFAGQNPCAPTNVPIASVDCDPTAIKECQPDYCGGCNRRYYDQNRNEICISQTRTCANVLCKADYRCYEGATLGTPTCQNTLTCDNIRCDSGYKCEQQSSGPTCILNPAPFILTCEYVECSSYHDCVPDAQGLAQCIPKTGACSSQECATKPTCWDTTVAAGGTCSRLASGKCTWTGTTCPFQPDPPPTNANGDKNCLVSAWTAWSCSALNCGDSGVQIRTRTVTQAATGTGQVCPELISRGSTCIRTCNPVPPPPVVPVGTGACASYPGCTDDISNKCASPIAGATCTNGVWRVTGNVDISSLSFVGCNLAITGRLTGTSSTNLRIHACAKITTTDTATIAGRLSLDIYNVSLASGSRVTVVQSSSTLSGTFGTTLVTGFSITDPSIPFKAGYTAASAYVDFGFTTPPPSTTSSTTSPPPSTTVGTTTGTPPATTSTATTASTTTPTTSTPTTTSPTTTSPTTTSVLNPPPSTTATTSPPTTTAPTTSSPATTTPTTTAPTTSAPTTTAPTTTAPSTATTAPSSTSTSSQPVIDGHASSLAPVIALVVVLAAIAF